MKGATALVYGILKKYSPHFLSAREIVSKIYYENETSIKISTVRDALRELEMLYPTNVTSRIERIGAYKVPTQKFNYKS